MPKIKTSPAYYKIVGKTSDGVSVLKPKMASGHSKELRAMVERMMAVGRRRVTGGPKTKTVQTRNSGKKRNV